MKATAWRMGWAQGHVFSASSHCGVTFFLHFCLKSIPIALCAGPPLFRDPMKSLQKVCDQNSQDKGKRLPGTRWREKRQEWSQELENHASSRVWEQTSFTRTVSARRRGTFPCSGEGVVLGVSLVVRLGLMDGVAVGVASGRATRD